MIQRKDVPIENGYLLFKNTVPAVLVFRIGANNMTFVPVPSIAKFLSLRKACDIKKAQHYECQEVVLLESIDDAEVFSNL